MKVNFRNKVLLLIGVLAIVALAALLGAGLSARAQAQEAEGEVGAQQGARSGTAGAGALFRGVGAAVAKARLRGLRPPPAARAGRR